MNYPIIIHEQHREFIYPIQRDKVVVRLKVIRKSIKKCTLLYFDSLNSGVKNCKFIPMSCYAKDNIFDYYECIIATEGVTCYINYFFKVYSGSDVFWFNYYGPSESTPIADYFKYQYTNEQEIFRIPEWVKNAIVYQIFPERFFNEESLDNFNEVDSWGSEPTRLNFMGGNLRGIIKKIDYIKKLGINTIYLNPIFESPSNHKYDTTDYFSIDSHFGSLEDFKELVETCHQSEIRVILDGVFNHCGYDLDKFQDVIKNGLNSRYCNWFNINEYPIDSNKPSYDCFGRFYRMPKLKLENPEVREYVLSIIGYWMETAHIDGWRLDVADEIDYTFLQELRRFVKAIDSDCLIMAETWKENTDLLKGDQVDSVMNYLFRDAVVNFFGKSTISSFEFDARLNRFIGIYRNQVIRGLYNLIGSHDTERFLTVCSGDIRKMKAAIAFQFCFIGVPSIYYGDEIGIEGENDPGCRKCMQWQEESQKLELYNFYKKMIELRKSIDVLKTGDFKSNYCCIDNNVYGFIRFSEGHCIYIVINNSDYCNSIKLPVYESPDGGSLTELLGNSQFLVEILARDDFYFDNIVNGYKGVVNIELQPYQICLISGK